MYNIDIEYSFMHLFDLIRCTKLLRKVVSLLMNDSNFTLLSQTEIDALINFLSLEKTTVNNEVLNQHSIDKLIQLMRSHVIKNLNLEALTVLDDKISDQVKDPLVYLGLRDNETDPCLLFVSPNTEDDYLELCAKNILTNNQILITPKCIESNAITDSDYLCNWGYSIAPVIFDTIASNYGLKYTDETFKQICSIYAEKNYGDPAHGLPKVFLPSSTKLLYNLYRGK